LGLVLVDNRIVDMGDARTVYVFAEGEAVPYRYVHPLKREKVRAFLAQAFPPYVKHVVLFGNSVTPWCEPRSDVDLYFVLDRDPAGDEAFHAKALADINALCRPLGPYDFLMDSEANYLEELADAYSVEHQAYKEGVLLYAEARQSDAA
jgi:hypothetical protein